MPRKNKIISHQKKDHSENTLPYILVILILSIAMTILPRLYSSFFLAGLLVAIIVRELNSKINTEKIISHTLKNIRKIKTISTPRGIRYKDSSGNNFKILKEKISK